MSFPLAYIITFFLASIRLAALVFMIPAFGGTLIPAQIRIILVLLMTVLIVPNIPAIGISETGISIWEIAFYGVGEILIGLFLGVCVRSLFAIVEVAGMLISRNMGLMMAQQFDPASGTNSNIIGVILFYVTTILFFCIGGHHQVIKALAESFLILPTVKTSWVVGNFTGVATILGEVFSIAISLAAPFIAVNFIITLGFGVLGKVAPKINVMLISFSFRIVGGLAVFLISANLIFNILHHYSERIPSSMLKFLAY